MITTYSFIPPHQGSFPLSLKNFIFSCSYCSCTIFILTSYSLYTQVILILILIDVQYLQNVFSALKKVFESSESLIARFPPPDKKIPPQCGGFSPTPSRYLENPG